MLLSAVSTVYVYRDHGASECAFCKPVRACVRVNMAKLSLVAFSSQKRAEVVAERIRAAVAGVRMRAYAHAHEHTPL